MRTCAASPLLTDARAGGVTMHIPAGVGSLRVMCGYDDGLCATDGLPSAADAPLQRSELAKGAIYGSCTAANVPV